MPSKEEIQAQIRALQVEMELIEQQEFEERERKRKEEEEEKKKRELEKPLNVKVTNYDIHYFTSKGDYRSDYLEVKKTKVPGWKWDSYNGEDKIPISSFDIWLEETSKLPNVKINISDSIRLQIEYILRGPDVHVMLSKQGYKIKLKAGIDSYSLFGYDMASIARLNQNDHHYYIPLNEGARLLMKLKDKGTWDDDARAKAEEDLTQRDKLNAIALAKYSEFGDVKLENDSKLRPFQTVSVEFGSIVDWKYLIADEMGLGKTWQAIASVLKAESKKVAVIVPASVKVNWQRAIKLLTNDEVYFCDGTQPSTHDLSMIISGKYKWYLFNYDMFARPLVETKELDGVYTKRDRYLWAETLNPALGFDHLILDEAHRCKNLEAGRTKAIRQIKLPKITALTGTPILNRPQEMWPILNMLDPAAFPSYEGFINRYTNGNYGVKNLQELKELLSKYMIRRTIKDVMPDLPPINRITRLIELDAKQQDIYNTILQMVLVDFDTGDEIGEINHILVKILRLKQFMSSVKSVAVADFAREIYDEADVENPHKKVIIFSQFVDEVRKISKLLGGETLTIIGSEDKPENRQLIVDRFQTDPSIHFLVASVEAANEGLTITAAGSVIFVDFAWTPKTHQQAEGRAYGRLNDPHPINSYYFACKDTLDDWLQSVLLRKLSTIEAVVDGVQVMRQEEDSIIKEMFQYLRSLKRK